MSSRNKRKSKSSKSNSGQHNSQKKPSPTAQILEHVEWLIALHEERGEPAMSVGGSDAANLDVNDLAKGLVEKIEPKIVNRFDAIEEKLAAFKSNDFESSSLNGAGLESLIERFDAIESKLTTIEETIQNSDDPIGTDSNLEERFEAIDTRLGKVAEAIAGQQKLIESQSQNQGSATNASIVESFQTQFSEMLSQMKQELAAVSTIKANSIQEASDELDSEKQEAALGPDWSRQKQAMLSKYGIDPEHRPDMAPPTEPDPVMETTMADETLSEELSATVQLDTEETVSTEPEEIQRIKKELNSKLRDAEVNLSIERAKLSQLEAELESKQIELERRDSELSAKYKGRQNSNSDSEQFSLLDRLKKHLTAKDRKNLDRI